MRGSRSLAAALLFAAGVGGCVTLPASMQPAPRREFTSVLADARKAATDGRYADADRALAQFAAQYPDSPEAAETRYWRALLALDPANQSGGSVSAALSQLDQYIAHGSGTAHYDEALTLRRLAFELQTATHLASAAAATPTVQTRTVPAPEDKARDAEIQRLRDSLAKADDELDRIKRRLTTPTRP